MMSIVEAALKNRHPMLERGSPLRDVAKKEVMPRYLKVAHQRKSDGSLFTEADIAAQEALSRRLPEIYSGPIVAEEMTAEQQAEYWLAGTEGLWCVDPIDGTSNFVNGLPYFAVSVALMKEGKSVLGVVYDPFADEVFYAEKGGGAFLNGERLPIKQQSPLLRGAMAQVDFNRLPDRLARDLVRRRLIPRSAILAPARGMVLRRRRALRRLSAWRAVAWDYAAGSLILGRPGADVQPQPG